MYLLLGLGLLLVLSSDPQPVAVPQAPGPATGKTVIASPAATAADWTERYIAANQADRAALIPAGRVWAEQRRATMKELVRRDPEAAIRAAIPFEVREKLPAEILGRIERPISGRGSFEVLVTCNFEEATHEDSTSRFATIDGIRYEVHAYGRRLDVTTKREMLMHGIAVDEAFAMHDEPLRVLSPGEKSARGIDADVAVDAGGEIRALRDEAELNEISRRLVAAEDAANPFAAASPAEPDVATASSAGGDVQLTSTWTEGAKTLLYIMADFADLTGGVVSVATASNAMNALSQYYDAASYGKTQIAVTYVPEVVHLTNSIASYTNDFYGLLADATAGALTQGFNYANYSLYVVMTGENSSNGNFSYAGKAWIGDAGVHLVSPYYTLRTAGHEIGHNYGLWHANYWRTDSDWPIGRDSVPGGYTTDATNDEWVEYGHRFSLMSAQSGTDMDDGRAHFAAREKLRLNWIATNEAVSPATSGVFRIYPQDRKDATNCLKSVTINKTSSDYTGNARQYALSYRKAYTNYPSNLFGVQVDWVKSSYGSDGVIQLDMTPFSSDDNSGASWTDDNADKQDGALLIGRTYADPPAKIYFTPTAIGGTSPYEWIDVSINIGTFSNNSPPSLVLTASTNAAATNAWITFAAEASDADGDPLAYSWDFTTPALLVTNSLNRPACSNFWTKSGEYVVRCTVSDMKGGENTTSLLIRIGSPTNVYRITGRVWANNFTGGVEGVRVFTSYTNSAYTLSDGSFILPNIKNSTNTVQAMLLGNKFAPSFASPVVVGPTATNIDFAMGSAPGVLVTKSPVLTATEGGSNTSYLIRLLSSPSGAVIIAIGSDTGQVVIASPAQLSSTNWIQGARVTVAAVDDTVYEPLMTTVVVAHAVSSPDSNYNGAIISNLLVTIIDNDANVDNDGDGMTDAFELQFFGNATNAAATADADGDGYSNLAEYIAGTVPTNAASRLTLIAPPPDFLVDGLTGRTYVIQASATLDGTNWIDVANIAGTGTPVTITVTNTAAQRFYRLSVRMP